MKTIFMMKGLPASGKSTRAKQMLSDFGYGNAKRVSKDDLRAMLDDGHWSGKNEKFVLGARDYVITTALNAGLHVIVDDTNLKPAHEARLRELAKSHDAAFEIVDFTAVSPDECVERDRKRSNYVGEQVIRSMWKQFLAPKITAPEHDPALNSCILVDVDGTLAIMNGRGPFDWQRVGEDQPNKSACELVRLICCSDTNRPELIFVSGRDESCRELTEAWIRSNVVPDYHWLYMRPAGDMRDDRIVKREVYDAHIRGKFNVLFVLDDRKKVVEQWRAMGLPCFQVAEGDF